MTLKALVQKTDMLTHSYINLLKIKQSFDKNQIIPKDNQNSSLVKADLKK